MSIRPILTRQRSYNELLERIINQVCLCSMRIRIVAIAIALLVCKISLTAQNMPWMPVSKLGKLVAGDTLSIRFLRPPEDKLDGAMNLSLTVSVLEDGTITLPVLDRVPAAGLSIMELNTALQQRYAAAFIHPPYGFTTSTPPRVTVGYVGHLGGTAMDKLIERIGKSSAGRQPQAAKALEIAPPTTRSSQ